MSDREHRRTSKRESKSEELIRKARASLEAGLQSRGDQLPFDTSSVAESTLERFDDLAERVTPAMDDLVATGQERLESAPPPVRERLRAPRPRRARRSRPQLAPTSPVEPAESRRRITPGWIIFIVFVVASILRGIFGD